MNFRSDQTLPNYIAGPIANGATAVGEQQSLYGAAAMSIQVVLANGAAGTLLVEGTNGDGGPYTYQLITTQAVPSNGTALFSYSLADAVVSMRAMRCRFTASAGGTVTVAINIRRTAV